MSAVIKSLLSIKRWKEDEAKNRFAVFLKELSTEEKRLLKLESRFKSISEELECGADRLINIDEIKKLNEYLGHLIVKIDHQKRVIIEKEKQVEAARNRLMDASKDRKIFERLDEKQMEALGKEHKRKEQIGTDEHAATRHGRRGK